MLNCIALDDEPLALRIIRAHAAKVSFVNLEAAFASGTEALSYLQHHSIDVIFLDINMPDVTGIQLASMIDPKVKIIFTTAYPEFAINGFELAATDYLLKPIGYARFLQACTRAQEQIASVSDAGSRAAEEYMFVKDGYSMVRINFKELLYVQADDNYLTFHETQKKIVARMTLAEALEKLPEKQFMRVHKSYIISISKIDKIDRHQVIVAGTTIPVSSTYRQALFESVA